MGEGVGAATTDNSAYDVALVIMTLIPPCFVVIFIAFVGCYQLPGELRTARDEYQKAVQLAAESKQATVGAYKDLFQPSSRTPKAMSKPSMTSKKVFPAPAQADEYGACEGD